MSGHANYDDCHDDKYGKPHDVPLIRATESNIAQYGHFVDNFEDEQVEMVQWPQLGKRPLYEGTGKGGGIVSGSFLSYWEGDLCHAINEAVPNGKYIIGRLPKGMDPNNRTHVLTREANYHPDGGQVFYPKGCMSDHSNLTTRYITHKSSEEHSFVSLLALPGDDIQLSSFKAFYFDGSRGLQIKSGIWHQPTFPVNDSMEENGKQGAIHACVCVDTVKEFGKWLKIPMKEEYIDK